jgi:hypothetical protein
MTLYAIGAAIGGAVLAIFAAFGMGRRAGKDASAAQAAQHNQERTHAGNEAARAAERDGAAERMRRGDF